LFSEIAFRVGGVNLLSKKETLAASATKTTPRKIQRLEDDGMALSFQAGWIGPRFEHLASSDIDAISLSNRNVTIRQLDADCIVYRFEQSLRGEFAPRRFPGRAIRCTLTVGTGPRTST
jgi:hypothetical protein